MRTRILVSAVSFALVFGAFGAGAVFADPGTMGKSGSNPDGGGLDKPVTGTSAQGGGTQGPAYFDGNNGCGKDRRQDIAPDQQGGFDDNNGHCGKVSSHEQGQAHVSQVSHASERAQIHAAEQSRVSTETQEAANVSGEAKKNVAAAAAPQPQMSV